MQLCSLNSLMTLLGPEQHPHHIEDWLRWRILFQPGSKLIKAGLMKVEHDPDGNPGELLDAYARITNQGFRRITGAKP